MKRFFRYTLLSALALILIILSYSLITYWILFSPNENFPYHLEYNEFNIRSDEPIEENLIQKLDSVTIRLASVLDYDKGVYQIYLCNNPKTYGIFSRKVGKPINTQGFNIQPLNHIFINVSFVKEMKSRNNSGFKYHIIEGDLSHLIAHEICHQLIAGRIGFIRMRNVDSWKLEGYCEYSASKHIKEIDVSYSFGDFVTDFFGGQFYNISTGRKFYIESLIITEYYLDYKNKSFIDLVNDNIDKEKLLQEIKRRNQAESL